MKNRYYVIALLLLAGCGSDPVPPTIVNVPPPPPVPTHDFTFAKIVIKVPTTNSTGGTCPDGMFASRAMMYFFQNGSPDRLELDCVGVK